MKILITGIHGFVGSNLVKALSKEHEIYALATRGKFDFVFLVIISNNTLLINKSYWKSCWIGFNCRYLSTIINKKMKGI